MTITSLEFVEIFRCGGGITDDNVADFVELLSCSDEMTLATLTAAWKVKGYTPSELAIISQYIKKKYLDKIVLDNEVIDCCGTGGDFSQSYNISTTVAILLASMGVTVAKHGGRSTTSQSGSIDFLEALGLATYTTKNDIIASLQKNNLAFIASPALHQVLGQWKAVCKKLEFGGQTGLIGTLTNPVELTHQIIGVPQYSWGELMIKTLQLLKRPNAMVVYGEPRLDEASIAGITHIWHLDGDLIEYYSIRPEACGLTLQTLDSIRGGTPSDNAKIFRELLREPDRHFAVYEAVLLNAALALLLLKKTHSLIDALSLLNQHIRGGHALNYVEKLYL